MNGWINLNALWRIMALGLVCGAGLPALFALGLRALGRPAAGSKEVTANDDQIFGGTAWGLIAGGLCFILVAAAIFWGIYLTVVGG